MSNLSNLSEIINWILYIRISLSTNNKFQIMEQHSRHQIIPIDAIENRSSQSKNSQDELIQEEQEEKEIKSVWFCELFRFATCFDVFLMVMGSIGAIALGASMPAFAFIWGQMTDAFQDDQQMVTESKKTMFLFIYIGVGAFVAGWLMFGCWMIAGQRQAIACRKAYLRSLLKQEIAWFDSINQTELASNFATDTFAFQGAIGQKVSTIIMTLASVISGFVFAFISGWLMTLVVLSVVPALGIAGAIYISAIMGKDKREKLNYAKAGGKATQAITGIKTVKQLGGEEYEVEQYEKCLQNVSKSSLKYAIYLGIGMGSIFMVMLLSYSLGFWYGSRCIMQTENCPEDVAKQTYTAGDVLVVFFSVVIGGFNLSQFSPSLKKITEGQQAAARIFEIIDRQPQIVNPQNGKKIQNLKGIIRFQNVTFCYPKDKERKILNNLTMEFDANKTGLVGESGCGKSTIMQLLMRFYDPNEGKITLDGHDLKELDLEWLRKQIGYVGQEPILFATSIKENLLFGNEGATDEEIESALKKAEAYDFIQELEEKMDTYVGYGGGQLSGGQKQRIAIARGILRNPKILLLDEATSALDRRNEKMIQDTLNEISEGRTTITIAHRVKTIMNSDIIYVLDKGGIAEKGKFKQISKFKNFSPEQEKDDRPEEQDMNKKKNQEQKKIKKTEANQPIEGEEVEQVEGEEQKKQVVDDAFKTKDEIEAERQKQLVKKYEQDIFGRLFAYSSSRFCTFLFGIIAALANGVIFPIFSIFLARMLTALLELQIDKQMSREHEEENLNNIRLYTILFLVFGIAAFILTTIQTACFTYVGEEITKRIRLDTYKKILKMPVSWFQIPRNNGGSLAARLSTDCQLVNTVTTTTVSISVQNISTLVSAIVIAFVFQWRTALVALGMMPFMIISGILEMSMQTGFSDKTDEAYKDSSHMIMEAMINIRTVSSFGTENFVIRKYDQKMEVPYGLGVKKGHLSGILYGFSQVIMFTIFGVLFFVGALFVRDHKNVEVDDMFTALYAIIFAGMTAGNNAHFMPDAAACSNAAANLFEIQDSVDQGQQQQKEKSKMLTSDIEGDIELKNVSFKYQSRNEYVFQKMNLKIPLGKKVAFVGASGCGKSTIIQLLQRFYEPSQGQITINGVNIKDFDIKYLRQTFGVVSQQPVLFLGSFKENIRYNKADATDNDIIDAATRANAMSFILGKEKMQEQGKQKKGVEGMDRNVGVGGSHISGGQKQRVAIARTIIRNPKKLLLDEATSALDSQNEKIVQEALDKLMEGRTVISIAHRIDTIKNCDEIFMFEKGVIVESGNYNTLVGKKGHFYNLERGTQFV